MATQALERLYKLTVDAGQATRQLQKLNTSVGNIDRRFSLLARGAAAAFSAMKGFQAVKGLVDTANQLDLLEASFTALTSSAERGGDLLARSFSLVEETGAGFDDVVTSLQRLTIGMRDLGASNDQIEGVAESFIKIGRIGGTSMFSINQALVQFTQGLSSGRLQGDELRSILERVPLITDAIAKEMGKTRGEIKDLGREGKITADIMVNALLNALPGIAEDFKLLPVISEQAINRIGAQWIKLQSDFAKDTGLADAFVVGLQEFEQVLSGLRPNIRDFVKDVKDALQTNELLQGVLVGLAGTITFVLVPAMVKLAMSNPFLAFATAAGAAAVYIVANWEKVSAWFTYKMPTFIDEALGHWWFFSASAIEAVKMIPEGVESAMNGMLRGFTDLSVALAALPFFDASIVTNFSEVTFTLNERLQDAADSARELGRETFNRAIAGAAEYDEVMKEIEGSAESAGEALEGLSKGQVKSPINTVLLEKELQGLKDKIDPVGKIIRQFEENIETLRQSFAVGLLGDSPEEFNYLIDRLIKTRDEALAAVDPLKGMREELARIKDIADPAQAIINTFAEQIQVLNEALAAEDIDPEKYAEIAAALALVRDEALQGLGSDITTLLEDIKNAMDGFARDFTNELVDGLREGKIQFKEFAADVLATISKIMLNRVFTQFFEMIATGLTGGGWGAFGGSGGSGGGGGGLFGRSLVALPAPAIAGPSTRRPTTLSGGGIGFLSGPNMNRRSQGRMVNVTVNNNAPVDVSVKEKKRGDEIDLEFMIEKQVAKSIAGGGLDRSMQSSYGITRRAY